MSLTKSHEFKVQTQRSETTLSIYASDGLKEFAIAFDASPNELDINIENRIAESLGGLIAEFILERLRDAAKEQS